MIERQFFSSLKCRSFLNISLSLPYSLLFSLFWIHRILNFTNALEDGGGNLNNWHNLHHLSHHPYHLKTWHMTLLLFYWVKSKLSHINSFWFLLWNSEYIHIASPACLTEEMPYCININSFVPVPDSKLSCLLWELFYHHLFWVFQFDH